MNSALCKGIMEDRLVTHTEDLGTYVVVIRGVPAYVCEVCGNNWFTGTVAERLEGIVDVLFASASIAEIMVVVYGVA